MPHYNPNDYQPKKANLNISESKEIADKKGIQLKPGTAITKPKGKQLRVSSAGVRRPDTRYKKETLCHKLELGNCVKKDEFYIPFLSWGSDPHNKNKLPECWKDDNFGKEKL